MTNSIWYFAFWILRAFTSWCSYVENTFDHRTQQTVLTWGSPFLLSIMIIHVYSSKQSKKCFNASDPVQYKLIPAKSYHKSILTNARASFASLMILFHFRFLLPMLLLVLLTSRYVFLFPNIPKTWLG